ncbi:MAG: lysylphosphatidylglycerol synthase transmembrane domain-containing protein [Candidatus Bathyarchaeia archaeon]
MSSSSTCISKLSVKISLKNAFLYYWAGYFVDLVVPCETVCGELTRLYLVHKETNDNYGVIAAGGITNRIIAYLIVVTGLFTSAGLLFLKSKVPAVVLTVFIFVIIGATAYLAVLLYLAFSENAAGKIAALGLRILKVLRPKKYHSSDLSPETKESLAAFYSGFKIFRENPRYLAKPVIYLTISWLFNLSQYILVFYALGIFNQSFSFFIIIYFVAGSLTDVSASFSVGTLDILLATIFVLYGLNPALSGITAALVRSVTFWSPLIIGYVIVQIVGAKNVMAPPPRQEESSITAPKVTSAIPGTK